MENKLIFIHGLLGSRNNFAFLEKEFSNYNTTSIDLIGFGKERKPKLKYELKDFLDFLEQKLDLSGNKEKQYILIGHSLGSLLAKELTIRHPDRIINSFLISYPFLEKGNALLGRSFFDRKYAEGVWWTKILCQTEILYKWLFFPFIFIFRYKYRKSYMDAFNHTYHSAYGTIRNTILVDKKERLSEVSDKVFLINGERDPSVDMTFAREFNNYIIKGMGHAFFGHEKRLANIIKSNIPPTPNLNPSSGV